MINEIYTIADAKAFPVFFRNNHDFKDETGLAPQIGEKITPLFTKALYAVKYIKESNAVDAYCLIIKDQEDFDYIKNISNDSGVKRFGCNVCITNNQPHERLFPLVQTSALNDFKEVIKLFDNVEKCDICYDENNIANELGVDRKVSILGIQRNSGNL